MELLLRLPMDSLGVVRSGDDDGGDDDGVAKVIWVVVTNNSDHRHCEL